MPGVEAINLSWRGRIMLMLSGVRDSFGGFWRGLWRKAGEIVWRRWRKRAWWALVALLIIGSVIALLCGPGWLIERQGDLVKELERNPIKRHELENENRRTIAQGVLAVLGVFALVATWRRMRAMEETVKVAQEGQITERFVRAIQLLGATGKDGEPVLEIRLGGIYALERIARDSVKDHGPIMEVLTAYVRENAPITAVPGEEGDDPWKKPRVDVQAILNVLGRRRIGGGRGSKGGLDLSHTDLRGADLIGAHLERADLSWAHLSRAVLRVAHLDGADLSMAHLEKADLGVADLEGANLHGANLEGAHLEGADLRKARVYQSQIDRTFGDGSTKLPEGIEPPSEWRI